MSQKEELEKAIAEADETHKYYHAFCKYMSRWYFSKGKRYTKDLSETKREFKFFDGSKMIGYDAMLRIERYAKLHPEIKVCRVDDDVFAGSILVLVPHPEMGITVFFVPQCTNTQNAFFLYPQDSKELIDTLVEMKKVTG